MEREELIDLVRVLCEGGYDEKNNKQYSEKEFERLVELFEKNIPNECGADLIFYPKLCGLSSEPTVEEIVDKALE